MDRDTYLNMAPFEASQTDKDIFYEHEMNSLTDHHRKSCAAYDDICNGLNEQGPYLPVSIFKDLELRSVPEDQISKTITSSGTTGQKVSRIFLDSETSLAQQRALCMITGDFIGGDRIPMLIIDSPDVLKDRKKFSARGAGILGFAIMSSRRYYALTPDMEPDWDSIRQFQEEAAGGPSFAFGFTYMIWSCFYEAVKRSGRKLDLSNCYLIHGGGWKKLQNQSVSDEVFKAGLKETCNIDKVANYYGMAEQTGSIFMECPEGHLHASMYSDIRIINPEDFSECETGQWGLIALQSFLPGSYPGHRLLTEDWGRVLGVDDCPCGRKGKYFEIRGRIKKAEIRGCSDTFEGPSRSQVDGAKQNGAPDSAVHAPDITVLTGTWPPVQEVTESFSPETMDFLEALSTKLTREAEFRQYPDILALGFWCRRSHMEQLQDRQQSSCSSSDKSGKGVGLTLHITPSNMPTMFAYSWITSLLAGNPNIVRLSERDAEISDVIIRAIGQLLQKPEFEGIASRNAFLRFPRGHRILEEISSQAAGRIIWGGDATVEAISSIPAKDGCMDIPFPDKYSIALLNADDIKAMDDRELALQAHLFYRDTYGADQNACSSPRTVFWLKPSGCDEADLEQIKCRWWDAIAEETKQYDFQPWMATEKYRLLCCTYAQHKGLDTVRRWGNRLYVVPLNTIEDELWTLEAKMGLFYEYDLNSMDELYPFLGSKIQTIVASGENQEQIYTDIRNAGCPGIDRVVRMGEALEFDTIWDRKDMIDLLSI